MLKFCLAGCAQPAHQLNSPHLHSQVYAFWRKQDRLGSQQGACGQKPSLPHKLMPPQAAPLGATAIAGLQCAGLLLWPDAGGACLVTTAVALALAARWRGGLRAGWAGVLAAHERAPGGGLGAAGLCRALRGGGGTGSLPCVAACTAAVGAGLRLRELLAGGGLERGGGGAALLLRCTAGGERGRGGWRPAVGKRAGGRLFTTAEPAGGGAPARALGRLAGRGGRLATWEELKRMLQSAASTCSWPPLLRRTVNGPLLLAGTLKLGCQRSSLPARGRGRAEVEPGACPIRRPCIVAGAVIKQGGSSAAGPRQGLRHPPPLPSSSSAPLLRTQSIAVAAPAFAPAGEKAVIPLTASMTCSGCAGIVGSHPRAAVRALHASTRLELAP
jgi:hypothetical protein